MEYLEYCQHFWLTCLKAKYFDLHLNFEFELELDLNDKLQRNDDDLALINRRLL